MIDLRSDTVTRPSKAMLDAMMSAPLGDDVYGEDPTVNEIEQLFAQESGHESALYVQSGTQGNFLCLLTHCQRGDEYIVANNAHNYLLEGGGAAAFGGIQPCPLAVHENGGMDINEIEKMIKPVHDPHFAKTRLISIENTTQGRVLDLQYLRKVRDLAQLHHLALHLDGARIFNAKIALGCSFSDIAGLFDSVSVCLSKGLGAPVGTVILGSSEFIEKARHLRKAIGGGLRQAGVVAAAGIYAFKNNVERIKDDHANARLLAEGITRMDSGFKVVNEVQSNMVFVELPFPNSKIKALGAFMKDRDIMIQPEGRSGLMRLVLHLDISSQEVHVFLEALKNFSRTH